jgi:hypothetical protein
MVVVVVVGNRVVDVFHSSTAHIVGEEISQGKPSRLGGEQLHDGAKNC